MRNQAASSNSAENCWVWESFKQFGFTCPLVIAVNIAFKCADIWAYKCLDDRKRAALYSEFKRVHFFYCMVISSLWNKKGGRKETLVRRAPQQHPQLLSPNITHSNIKEQNLLSALGHPLPLLKWQAARAPALREALRGLQGLKSAASRSCHGIYGA